MSDYTDLKLMAEAATGFTDMSLAPDVVLDLIAENERLREGMKGDYDLDAWLDWTKEAEALRKDAERYLFMRNQAGPSDWEYISHQIPAVVDHEIDALMDKYQSETDDD